MSSLQKKKHGKRKNNSRKKGHTISYCESMSIPPMLAQSFIGKEGTLPVLLKGYKASLYFDISPDKKVVILRITAKHRNHLTIIMEKLTERYNKIITITNNLIKHVESDER